MCSPRWITLPHLFSCCFTSANSKVQVHATWLFSILVSLLQFHSFGRSCCVCVERGHNKIKSVANVAAIAQSSTISSTFSSSLFTVTQRNRDCELNVRLIHAPCDATSNCALPVNTLLPFASTRTIRKTFWPWINYKRRRPSTQSRMNFKWKSKWFCPLFDWWRRSIINSPTGQRHDAVAFRLMDEIGFYFWNSPASIEHRNSSPQIDWIPNWKSISGARALQFLRFFCRISLPQTSQSTKRITKRHKTNESFRSCAFSSISLRAWSGGCFNTQSSTSRWFRLMSSQRRWTASSHTKRKLCQRKLYRI